VDASLPNPLTCTSEQFCDAGAGRFLIDRLGGRAGALEAYRRFYRLGAGSVPGLGGFVPTVTHEMREQSPEGEVVKFLTSVAREAPGSGSVRARASLPEMLSVESVLIPMIGSAGKTTYTLCVSSQVGCAMGCTFCETAQMGLIRSLTSAEIVAQWYAAAHLVRRDDGAPSSLRPCVSSSQFPVKNIVFMGMGEPFDNYDSVVGAIAILKDHNGAHVPASQICVSTVGRVDGIRRLAERIKEPGWHRLGLALSLNSAIEADREAIMPITRKYSLGEVQRALVEWPRFAGNKICVEYVLIPGQNDTREHAGAIARFMEPLGLHKTVLGRGTNTMRGVLNLIPYNPRRNSPWPAPTEERVEEFMGWLVGEGVFVKRRRTKGRAMMGACGQLGSAEIRGRSLVALTTSVG
jgi:23S rRNA (adenine2503-C2)-methyltransferase